MLGFLKRWKSDGAQRAVLTRASHLLECFLKGDKNTKVEAISSLMSASGRVMTHMETTATFVSMFEPINTNQLSKAAAIAERLSLNMASDDDPAMRRLADAYACLAVLCKNRLNLFSSADDVEVVELIAQLYGVGLVSKRSCDEKSQFDIARWA
jgi:hypothetical protein